MTLRRRFAMSAGLLIMAATRASSVVASEPPAMGLGHELAFDSGLGGLEFPAGGAAAPRMSTAPTSPIRDPGLTPAHPLYVRIAVPWDEVEPERGRYDWSRLDPLVGAHAGAGYRVLLALGGSNRAWDAARRLPGPAAPEILKGWLDFLRQTALHFLGQPVLYEIGDAPNGPAGWAEAVADYAFVLKQSSVTIRSADPEALVAVGALAVGADDLESVAAWQAALYDRDVATYLDALAVRPAPGADAGVVAGRFADLLLEHDPAAALWMVGVTPRGPTGAARGADLVRQFASAQSAGARLVTFALDAAADGRPEGAALLLDLHRLFAPGYAPRLGGGPRFESIEGGPHPAGDLVAASFFDPTTYQGLVVFEAQSAPTPPEAVLVLDTAAVKGAAIYDLVGGSAIPAEGARADFAGNTTRVPVRLRTRPQILLYARVPIAGFETEKEEVAVEDTGLFTAEEVIALHQRFQADQDYRLDTWSAGARVQYHYQISGSNTVDVAYDSRFFRGADGSAEWQQNALYLNGVRWKGAFPEIPFIQPDKVLTLPLSIHLDRAYDYEYLGRESVEGRDCHVVGFRPRADLEALYEGRAWIDRRTGALVRTSVVERGLKEPVVSNEETTVYTPAAGPDGATYWLMRRVDGQQVFLTAGRNLVVLRSIDFIDPRINDPEFDDLLAAAHASEAPMLRDTDQGLRTLVRGADGSRTLGGEPGRRTLFYALGVFYQPGFDTPVPLAGFDYFNYNLKGTRTQINAFLAGAVNAITLSRPRLLGPFDGTVEASVVAITFNDSYFVGGEEHEASRIDARPQSVAFWLGLPIGSFFRISGGYEFDYRNYNRDDETDTFTVPSDTGVHVLAARGEFNRGGWSLSAGTGRARRSTWEAWGDETAPSPGTAARYPTSPCDSPGSCLAGFDPDQDRYTTWDAGLAKQFFLPRFQKIRLGARAYGGSNLDRFSQYALEYFGPHVRGLSGSGVRFERGAIASLDYAFSLGDVIRLEGGVDYARIRDPLEADIDRDFTGAGFSGTLMGPWRSLVRFEAGVEVQTDYEALRGDFEAQVLFLKLF